MKGIKLKRFKIVKINVKSKNIKKNFIVKKKGFRENYEEITNANGRYMAKLTEVHPENFFNVQNIYRF